MSTPRRHHFVPRAYLERFGRDGRVLVRRRDRRQPFATNAVNVAVETGFYDTQTPEGERSVAVERLLAEIDGSGMEALRALDEAIEPPPVDSDLRFILARMIAVQFTRTPMLREQVSFPERLATYAGDRPIDRELVAEFLTKVHLGFQPDADEIDAAFDFATVALRSRDGHGADFAIDMMLRSVDQAEPILLAKHWHLEVARKPRLITSDAPLVVWREPTPRDDFEGVGLTNAEELRFPLDPGKQLVLTESPRAAAVRQIEPARVRACNADMADGCHQFVVGHPDRPKPLADLGLRKIRPVLRFNQGPLYRVGPDGTEFEDGEVLHLWVPRR